MSQISDLGKFFMPDLLPNTLWPGSIIFTRATNSTARPLLRQRVSVTPSIVSK